MKPKFTPNPHFANMPAHLKDYRNFDKIQRALFDVLQSTHSHSDVQEWTKCFPCQGRVRDHKEMMLRLGFTGGKQYLAWKRIMDIIINKKRVPMEYGK